MTAGARRAAVPAALAALLAFAAPARGFDFAHEGFTRILRAHVADGLVDYRALRAAPEELDAYLDRLAAVDEAAFRAWPPRDRMAFLFNLYNAATLRLVLDHYPVGSLRDTGSFLRGPWDRPVVRLFGKRITLDDLEHGILRRRYDEPRLHMALVCAAKGCPPLRAEAYTGGRLDEQLDEQARVYLASPAGLRIDRARGEARVSALFKWYGRDFPSVRAFVERYSGQRLEGLALRYLDYDWSLNDRAGAAP